MTTQPRLPFSAGGLPDRARERVERAAERGKAFFTSTFTAAELAVARLAGYEPLGQVMGSSMYHMGWNRSWGMTSGELDAHSKAKRHARELALLRLSEEAQILGAHAVVGVQLSMRGYEWSGELSEFTAIGTAVRTSGPLPARPALSNLSVQELYKLELSGLWPIDVVLGACTWYDPHADCMSDGSWFNKELHDHTATIDAAREAATSRFREDVTRVSALGAVAVQVTRSFHERHYETNDTHHTSFQAEVLLLGTAIERRAKTTLPRPRLVLDLGDRKIDLGERAELNVEE